MQFYARIGLISAENPGRGKSRLYSKKNIFELLIIAELRRNGLELKTIERLFDFLRKTGHLLDPKTYDKKNSGGYFLKTEDGGERWGYSGQRDPKTLKRTDIIPVDLSKYAGATVLNISLIYDRIRYL